jgi:hypothetical protein
MVPGVRIHPSPPPSLYLCGSSAEDPKIGRVLRLIWLLSGTGEIQYRGVRR